MDGIERAAAQAAGSAGSAEVVAGSHETAGVAASRAPHRGQVVQSLLRGPQPELRAMLAERTLVRTVAEWTPGRGLVVDLQASASGRGVRMRLRPLGDEAEPGWHEDVRRALRDVAVVAGRTWQAGTGTVTRLAELVRDPARSHSAIDDEWSGVAAGRLTERVPDAWGAPEVAWPESVHDRSGDILEALRGLPNAFVRVLLAAPTPMEREMLREELTGTWSRLHGMTLDAYTGAPVRIRLFAGVRSDARGARRAGSLAGLRSVLRGHGTALTFRDAGEAERRRFDGLDSADLAGFVRPEGWALALLRIPASGEAPVGGMRSVAPPLVERPLDMPLTRRTDALLLGTARTPQGRRTAVRIPVADLCRHVSIEGASGTGKTRLITQLVGELSRLGIGCTLLEHHGSGVDQALRALHPATAAQAIVVRHGDALAPGSVSLFDERERDRREQVIAEFADLMQQVFDPTQTGMVGPRWRRWFTLLCDAVATGFGEDATLLHVLAVAVDPSKVSQLAKRVAVRDRDLAFRLSREIGALSGDEAANLPAWAVSKFQPLVSQRTMREIVGRPRDSADVAALMEEGRTLLVDLGGPALGTPSARMLGALWLLKHWMAMGRRADRTRPHVIIVDEAHLMTFGALPAMLAEARKFGIGVVIASQSLDALSPELQRAIEANVGTRLTFRLGLNTAGRASAQLGGWPANELVRLPDLRAAASLMADGRQSEPFLLTVPAWPPVDLTAEEQAARLDARRVREWGPIAARPVVTDSEIALALAPVRSPRPQPPDEPPSFLDGLMSRRSRAGAAAPDADA